jgi:hypothetical protein
LSAIGTIDMQQVDPNFTAIERLAIAGATVAA